MSISLQILGKPGRDNALLALIDSGQSQKRLLFDCGEGCLSELAVGEILGIDHLFFSHCHMDHISGFDAFFRCTFGRKSRPNVIWGPGGTSRIMQHRFQGFLWNLHTEMSGSWIVRDVLPGKIISTRYELAEAFETAYDEGITAFNQEILDEPEFTVSAFIMNHNTETLAFYVKEKQKVNVERNAVIQLGLKPGPWLQEVKDLTVEKSEVEVAGRTLRLDELRNEILTITGGDTIAYLTDFLLDEDTIEALAEKLAGCKKIVCEAQYKHVDLDLAQKNYHMTVKYSAMLAKAIGAEELILFHISSRYNKEDWGDMLKEARDIFPNARFPEGWIPTM